VAQSAQYAGVSIETVYRYRKKNAKFRSDWADAIEGAFDALMIEMLRRARFGTERAIVYGGKETGVFTDMNDSMTMRLLSLHMGKVAEHKMDNNDGDNMVDNSDTYKHLMKKLADIKLRLAKASYKDAELCSETKSAKGNIDKE